MVEMFRAEWKINLVNINPTPYPDVNEILNLLLVRVRRILSDQFIGLYLFGSLANGDFDKHSDIDVLIVTDGEISSDRFSTLQNMHAEIAKIDSPWAVQQEVSYIPQNALRRFDPLNIQHPFLDRGEAERLKVKAHESDWIIQRYLLRERGIVMTGPDLKTLIDPVTPYELRQAVVDILPLWVDPIRANPTKIQGRGYQSFCVLSLCRMLYTLQNKAILSKPAAAKWAIDILDARWKPLIERAVIGRQNSNLEALTEDINETLKMMRYTLEVSKQPSIFPNVNEILKLLLSNTKEILKGQFIGMYLYGSLSSGDFDLDTSDIDFLVVTASMLSDKTIAELESMHHQIWKCGLKWASKLEGSYIPKQDIRRHNPHSAPCPTVNEGKFYLDQRGSDWIIQRHVIREQGIALAGPEPKTLIDPVSPEDIRRSVVGILHEWWFPMLEDPSWLQEHGAEYHAFAILTMCRALYALKHGTIVSKPTAARWVQDALGERWSQVIERALATRPDKPDRGLLYESLELIRFTREQMRKV